MHSRIRCHAVCDDTLARDTAILLSVNASLVHVGSGRNRRCYVLMLLIGEFPYVV